MKTFPLVVALALCWPAAISAQQAPTRLSLDEAIAAALANSRTLESAALEIDKSTTAVASARSQRLPNFKFTAQASQLLKPVDIVFPQGAFGAPPDVDTTVTTGRKVGVMLNGQIAQPLTQLHRMNLNVRLNETSLNVTRESAREARLGVVNNVKQIYYAILQTESSLQATEFTLSSFQELDRVMANRLAQRVSLTSDVLDVKTKLAEVSVQRTRVRNAMASQKEQLNMLMGREVTAPFETAGLPSGAPFEGALEMVASQAIAARPDVIKARLQVQQAELARQVAKAAYVPDVSLAMSYYSPLGMDGVPKNITTLGLQLEWEPFDYGRRGNTLSQRTLAVHQARNALRDAEDRAAIEIRSSFRTLEEARASLRVARLGQEAARERARVKNAQYEVDAALVTDVMQAQSALANANNDYQQAMLSFWRANADFEHALGQD